MTMFLRIVLVALLVALPRGSAAQAPEWVEDLARDIARRIERDAERLARHVEQRVEAQRGRGRARGPEVTEQFSRTIRLGRDGTFDLQNVSGDIVVSGGGGTDVRLEATKRVRHPNDSEARALLSELVIRVDERPGRVDVRTDHPRRRNWSGGVDYSVSVPRDANVMLRSVSGSVRVTSVNGELRAETISGDIVTSSTRRIRLVKTVSGRLDITDAEGDEVSASTVSGDFSVNRLKASGLDASSVSSDLRLRGVELDHASIRTVSGDIEYSGRLLRNGRYEFRSHSGDVRIAPGDNRGFTIEATTFSGDVQSDFPLTLQSLPGGSSFRPGPRNRSIRGSYGDAGATLTLQSFSGDIVISK